MAEYWLVDSRPGQKRADFYRLGEEGRCELFSTETDERVLSEALEGVWLRPDWLWEETLPNPLVALAEIVGREALLEALPEESRDLS